ncbi:hypothetical protein [Reyranella sp. CPCC 100927]|uniref:hypothetical protein n=1 Tax=Reyranella sp. CPCC 100927 TaxID=2599616 RepID=UPI0011B3E814|nr:hypothetical protein [Reyranella sp. CPCC 100927]TWS94987.1 hypothetical protein FQU96_40780 [Reyranella sp. CPCC 100927]
MDKLLEEARAASVIRDNPAYAAVRRLSDRAHSIVTKRLIDYGSIPSGAHSQALMVTAGGLAWQLYAISPRHRARRAYPLPCGTGKTQSVVAFAQALYEIGLEDGRPWCGKSFLVAQTQIDSLIALRRDMIAAGIPEDDIGLIYSGEEREVPPTTDNSRRPVLLVAHAKIKRTGDSAGKLEEVTQYRPRPLKALSTLSIDLRPLTRPRDLLIWDEVLLSTQAHSIATEDASALAAGASARCEEAPAPFRKECADYLARCWSLIKIERERQLAGHEPSKVTLPSIPEDLELPYIQAFKKMAKGDTNAFATLVEMNGMDARFTFLVEPGKDRRGGMVSFEVSVPDAFDNIAILDAGHAVNRLVRLDSRIGLAIGFDKLGVVKSYDNVEVHFANGSSGRSPTEKDWDSMAEKQSVSEIIATVKAIPAEEHVLIWTFKHSGYWRAPDLPTLIKKRLAAAGVDVEAKINGRDRISVATFGRHIGFNDWSRVENVIFAGVLQRDRFDLLSSSIAQVRDIMADTDRLIPVTEVSLGEVAGTLYQAISRGRCRDTVDGQAKPMKVWLRHHDRKIREELNALLPSAQWSRWYGSEARGGKIDGVAEKVEAALSSLPQDVASISVRKFKEQCGLKDAPNKTFQKAWATLAERVEWTLSGRSFVRLEHAGAMAAPRLGFKDETAAA